MHEGSVGKESLNILLYKVFIEMLSGGGGVNAPPPPKKKKTKQKTLITLQ